MRKLLCIPLIAVVILASLPAQAVSPAGERYIDLLTNGGAISIRNAAKSIYNTGEKNQQVLDTVAETLLNNYKKTGRDDVDAMAWAAKALGNSGNARYRDTLKEVADNGGHRKLRKYAKKSLKQLDNKEVAQYIPGSLALHKRKGSDASGAVQAATKTSTQDRALHPISTIREGMSMAEVFSLVGEPTTRTSHATGKQWIPFNFKGADNIRTIAVYKGQGRIIFANESNFSSGWRVIEVQLNENESGYL